MRKPMITIAAALLQLVASAAAVNSPADGAWPLNLPEPVEADAAERKADYVFMEAMRQKNRGNEDACLDLIGRAYRLNPRDTDIAFYYGLYQLRTAGNDTIMFNSGLERLSEHFAEDPSDYYNNMTYGSIAERLGSIDEAITVWATLDSLFPKKLDPAVHLAAALTQKGDSASLARAIGIYNRIETSKGKSIPLTTYKMRTYLAASDTAAVVAEAESLLASSPRNADYNVFAGDIFSTFGNRDSALVYYNRACEIDPASGPAHYAKANFYKESGDSAAYDREVYNALMQENLDLDTKLELMTNLIASIYTDPAQQPRIQELFATMLRQNPHEVGIHELYFSYLAAIDDYNGAAEQLGYAVDIDPSKEERWRSLVAVLMQADETDKAIAAADRALHYHPSSPTLYIMAGATRLAKEDYDKAILFYRKGISVTDSTDLAMKSELVGSIADVYGVMGERDSSFAYYDKALELNPRNYLALNNYAYGLAKAGKDLDRAEHMSAITLRERPEEATQLDTYAWVLFARKEYVEAQAYIERAIAAADEPSAELFDHAGDIYYFNHNPEKALEYWKKALELEPDNALIKRKVASKTHFYE